MVSYSNIRFVGSSFTENLTDLSVSFSENQALSTSVMDDSPDD
jgi:hypothetical protein